MKTTTRAVALMLGFAFAVTLSLAPGGQTRAAEGLKKEELSETYRGSRSRDVEYQKIAPFKVFDNLYYVGPGFVSAWLVPTPAGIIMIESAQEPYVDHVIDSIKKAGFDIKHI